MTPLQIAATAGAAVLAGLAVTRATTLAGAFGASIHNPITVGVSEERIALARAELLLKLICYSVIALCMAFVSGFMIGRG